MQPPNTMHIAEFLGEGGNPEPEYITSCQVSLSVLNS